jgi:hypothetical protein
MRNFLTVFLALIHEHLPAPNMAGWLSGGMIPQTANE